MLFQKSRKITLKTKHKNLHRLGLFLAVFGVVGGGIMLYTTRAATPYASPLNNPHGASCVQNTPSKTYVRPNERFTGVVQMRNTGTSTWTPSYGVFLSEFSSGATSGVTIWREVTGATFTGSTGPGGTRTFNLTVTAPSAPGVYNFAWGMHVVFQGYMYNVCPARAITVKSPPAVSLTVNGQPSNISLTQGAGLTLSWSASNGPTSCSASGNWSGAKSPPSGGNENRTADTATAGTKTYSLVCSNQVGSSSVISRSVVVTAPATSPAPSGSAPSPATPRPSSGGSAVPVVTTDTTPPSAPSEFKAVYNDTLVDLSWGAASDSSGIKGYELERSLDNATWQRIGDTITGEIYTDEDVNFDTTYYYRVRAVDQANNASGYATTEIKTGGFDPNAKADDSLVLTSDDGVAKVTIPAGALGEVASCSLKPSRYLQPSADGYTSISGPYEVLCKVASGNRVTVFAKPVTVQVILSDDQKKQYADYKFYTRASDWEEVEDVGEDNSFVLGESTDFALLGKIKKTPLWQKILITLFIIVAVVGVALIGLTRLYRWRLKRQIEQQNRDSYYKERGY